MFKHLFIFLFLILTIILFPQNISRAQEDNTANIKKLHSIINTIPINPQKAEQELLANKNEPLAKMYLAYMYMTDKIKIKDKNKVINQLMTEAINQYLKEDKDKMSNLAQAEYPKKFNSVKDIFEVMHFTLPDVPMWLAKEQPDLTFDILLASYFGGNRDNFLPSLDYDKSFVDVTKLNQVKSLLDYTLKVYGKKHTEPMYYGTMQYASYKTVHNLVDRISLQPKHYINITSPVLEPFGDSDPLTWNNAWNKMSKDKKFSSFYAAAQLELKNHYIKTFGLSSVDAEKASKNALNYLLIWYFYNNEFGAI